MIVDGDLRRRRVKEGKELAMGVIMIRVSQ